MVRLSDPWKMQHGREVKMPGGSRKTSGDLQKMQHGHEVMKPDDPWKTQHGREKMPGGRWKL